MATCSKPEASTFLQRGLHHRRRSAEELDSVRSTHLDGLQPVAGILGSMDRLHVVVRAWKRGIRQNARSVDPVLRGSLLLLQRPLQPIETTGLSNGRNAVRQPELIDVVRRRHGTVFRMERRADMGVAVHEAGRQEFTRAIDLEIAGWGAPAWFDRQLRRSHLLEHRYSAAFNDDVGGPPWRGRPSVDDGGLA